MVATPKTIAAVTKLLEEFADLAGRVDALEADRTSSIAAINQRIDVAAEPMIKRRDEIAAMLEGWWPQAIAADVPKGKKSMLLAGCTIGSRKSKDALSHSFESDDKAALALFKSRFRRQATRLKVSLDKAATLKLLQLGGKTGAAIAELGFSITTGTDKFYVERAEQAGTIGG